MIVLDNICVVLESSDNRVVEPLEISQPLNINNDAKLRRINPKFFFIKFSPFQFLKNKKISNVLPRVFIY